MIFLRNGSEQVVNSALMRNSIFIKNILLNFIPIDFLAKILNKNNRMSRSILPLYNFLIIFLFLGR